MTEREREEQELLLNKAMETLENYVEELAGRAKMEQGYGEALWKRISASPQILKEFAYYHDYGELLCQYRVAGYTLADILIWQVDHFKAYMDRGDEMNRYRQERLLLTAFDVMLQMEENPQPFINKMQSETGTDRQNP
ncbi:MAG: hypothetical protein NC081_09110 [Roseburia sp.]|nr:hypothetical protein [Roseburia sp.]